MLTTRFDRHAAVAGGAAWLLLGALSLGCGTTSSDETGATSANGGSQQAHVTAPRKVTVPAGTVMAVRFNQELSTTGSLPGDRFVAELVEPVSLDGHLVLESGADISGQVLEARSAKKIGGKSVLAVEFSTVETAAGDEVPLNASFYEEGKGQTKKDAAIIGGSAAGGAILGRIIGHQNDEDADGTAIGAIVGAAVGTAVAATNQKDEVVIPDGTVLYIRLDAPLTVAI